MILFTVLKHWLLEILVTCAQKATTFILPPEGYTDDSYVVVAQYRFGMFGGGLYRASPVVKLGTSSLSSTVKQFEECYSAFNSVTIIGTQISLIDKVNDITFVEVHNAKPQIGRAHV